MDGKRLKNKFYLTFVLGCGILYYQLNKTYHIKINCLMKKFSKSQLKKEIIAKYGSIAKMKKHLKTIAKNEYDCYFSEIKVYGCRIFYTSNPNHFCSFAIQIPHVGMSSTYALGKGSFTTNGKRRIGTSQLHNHYITL